MPKKKSKKDVMYLAVIEYSGYELKALSKTAAGAKKTIIDDLKRMAKSTGGKIETRFEGDISPAKFWEYMGAGVIELPLDTVVWP